MTSFSIRLVIALAILLGIGFVAIAQAKPHSAPQKQVDRRAGQQSAPRCRQPASLDEEYSSVNTPLDIPDGPDGVLLDSIVISDDIVIDDLDFRVNITHDWVRDLTLILTHVTPQGDVSALMLDLYPAGFAEDMTDCWFNDEATLWITEGLPPFTGDFKAIDSLAVFDGQSVNGVWRLEIRDRFAVDAGVLNSWSLEINHADMLSGQLTQTADPGMPAPQVKIEVADTTADPGSLPWARSNLQGFFSLPRLAAGTYTFRLTHPYFDSLTVENVEVSAGTILNLNLDSEYRFFTVENRTQYEIADSSGSIEVEVPFEIESAIPVEIVDVNAALDLRHTFIGDLGIDLTSGSGTTIELVRFEVNDSGDNLVGCRFDDEAEESILDGFVPFTGDWKPVDSLATYDSTTSSGNWTLTVTDYSAQDGGHINWAQLIIVYVPVTTGTIQGTVDRGHALPLVGASVKVQGAEIEDCTDQTGFYELPNVNAGPVVIEFAHQLFDSGLGWADVSIGAISNLNVSMQSHFATASVFEDTNFVELADAQGDPVIPSQTDSPMGVSGTSSTIYDLNVELNLTHTWLGDLDIWLLGPDGTTRVQLVENSGGESRENFIGTVFDDESCDRWHESEQDSDFVGTWEPVGSLSAFDSISANGNWTLQVIDNAPADTGYIEGWKLHIVFADDELAVESSAPAIPGEFVFHGNYPNPFNPSTTFSFELAKSMQVRLVLYNLLGQQVATIFEGRAEAGFHTIDFDASALASGVYLARLSTDSGAQTKKVVLLK